MKRLLAVLTILAVAPSRAQETVYVAPAPQPGDPAYISYRLDQLAESLRRSELDAARLEVFQSQAAVNRRLLDKIDREELESLVGLAAALESAGTEDQRQGLGVVITSKLEAMETTQRGRWAGEAGARHGWCTLEKVRGRTCP
jgi:hypothetical protein